MFSGVPARSRTDFSEKWEILFFMCLIYFPRYLMLMHNFRKKYKFPWRSPWEKFEQHVINFRLLFCCTLSSNRDNAQKWWGVQHMFLEVENWPHLPENVFREFCTLFTKEWNAAYSAVMYYFCHFYKKYQFFPGGGYVGKYGLFFPNCDLFFWCLTLITSDNTQKWGGVHELDTPSTNGLTLSENFFGNFARFL